MDVQKHQARGKFVRDAYDWEDDKRPHLAWNDVIAYSLHIRGFTKHSSSHAVHKGTYLGIVEKIPYLLQLGINQIQCMPVYEFDENQRHVNYWSMCRIRSISGGMERDFILLQKVPTHQAAVR